jgi:carboxyl-terminal processing protease
MRISRGVLGLVLLVANPANSSEVKSLPVLSPLQGQAQAAQMSTQILGKYAYRPVPLDDALSAKVMGRYIKSLDPDRSFFRQSDIDIFMNDQAKIDDAIADEDLTIPFSIFGIYSQRVVERMTYARHLLEQDFDFTEREEYSLARDEEPWPQSVRQSDDLWRRRVKGDWLRLRLAGQTHAAIRQTLDKRYANILARIYTYKSEDVFQSFMAAYTASVDPHTDYFGPAAAADFEISMKLSLVGIGAVLQERDGFTTIRELVPGGPAQLSGQLNVGDRIVGVGQGDGAVIEVLGVRLDEVVQMIRGTRNSIVRLDVLPANAGEGGQHQLVSLVRDKVSLEKQAATKTILPVENGGVARKIGVITLPAFYEDFEAHRKGEQDYRSASRDVAKLLEELKQANVDGILIDLRDNGGGSLAEAIDLTGLFIGKGPVVQQRTAAGKVEVEMDDLPVPAWSGPLGVLINRGSASASEIFAAAIQDYARGIVIGEASFGKGTVQTVLDLNQAARKNKPELGQLKLTVAQFFRINGATTQLQGVSPDISLPGLSDPKTLGETSYENALPSSNIKPARYKPSNKVTALLPQLQSRHNDRVKNDRDFKLFVEDVAELQAQREKRTISLNEADRRAEQSARAGRLKARERQGAALASGDDGLQAGERSLTVDLAQDNARKNAKDVLRQEAVSIVADEAELEGAGAAIQTNR